MSSRLFGCWLARDGCSSWQEQEQEQEAGGWLVMRERAEREARGRDQLKLKYSN